MNFRKLYAPLLAGLLTLVTARADSNLNFVPMTPCRIADTRNAQGTFGGPNLAAGSTRSFPIPTSSCGLPANASAYVLNLTVIPAGNLSYITVWPTGQTQPSSSNLNSPTGQVIANTAIVSAGTSGAISVYASNATGLIVDIFGYFVPQGTANSNVGTFGSSNQVPVFTVNASGQITAVSTASIPALPNFSDAEVPVGTTNGVNATFSLANTPAVGSKPLVTRNGVVQTVGLDYTIAGNTITFTSRALPQDNDALQIWYRY